MTEVDSAGITDVGKLRKANEDSYYMDDDLRIYVVADGMGGHRAGEVASRIVVETMQDKLNQEPPNADGEDLITIDQELSSEASRIMAGIHLANQAVFTLAGSNPDYKGMGSTVSAILLAGSRVVAANVGDSPIYLIRNNTIEAIYTPHTYLAEHAKLAPAGAKPLGQQYAHMITRAVGIKAAVQPDVAEVEGLPGDIFLICSDGLSDLLNPEEIKRVAVNYKPKKAVKILVDQANQRGGRDNITIIIIRLAGHLNGVENQPSEQAIEEKKSACLTSTSVLQVDYDTDEASHSALIRGLCETGGFIETKDAFTIGQALDLTFTDPESGDTFLICGVVADRKAEGIDIRFDALSGNQVASLKAAIEHSR